MEQHVNLSTHTEGNTLDLVISEATHGIEINSCEPGPFFSDHCVVKVVTKVQKENIKSQTIKYRNFKNKDHSAFTYDLNEMSITADKVILL